MAGSVNKVILIGNLGKDPEIRALENGTKLARFPLATSETFTDKTTGERREITDWHNIVVWRGLAEVVEKYVTKGQKIYIEGKLKRRSWQDESGEKRYSVEVVADSMTMLSKATQEPSKMNDPQFKNSKDTPKTHQKLEDDLMNDDDDDILPF